MCFSKNLKKTTYCNLKPPKKLQLKQIYFVQIVMHAIGVFLHWLYLVTLINSKIHRVSFQDLIRHRHGKAKVKKEFCTYQSSSYWVPVRDASCGGNLVRPPCFCSQDFLHSVHTECICKVLTVNIFYNPATCSRQRMISSFYDSIWTMQDEEKCGLLYFFTVNKCRAKPTLNRVG